MTGGQPHSHPVLTEDVWCILFTQAFLFATKYINRLRWRGTFGGVLPDGDDAESIAHQAVIDFLHQNPSKLRLLLRLTAREGRRGRHPSTNPLIHKFSTPLIPLVPRPIASALSRCVWRHVDRLHHRAENLLLRNEADLAAAYIDDGEICSFIETIPDPGGNPYENLVHKESDAEFEALKAQFREFLGREKRLKSLFNCCVNGIWQPRDLASRLHLSASATRNLQKRLKRRVHQFLEQQSHAE